MKRGTKACAALLAVVLLLCAVPAPTSAAPGGGLLSVLDLGKIGKKTTFVSVQIGDMFFIGKMRPIFEITDAELNKMVQEALKEAGLTEAEFSDLVKGYTQKDINDIRDAFTNIAGAIPATGASEAANIIKIIDQMSQGHYYSVARTIFDYAAGMLNGAYL